MAKHNITIRMGAAHWDATVSPEPGNTMHFDIRSMDRDQRREFFGGLREATHSAHRRPRRNKAQKAR